MGMEMRSAGDVEGMEMRSAGDVEMGQDITPPLFPLSSALHCSFLHSRCYCCFSPLPNISNHLPSPSPRYCSSLCSSSAHFSPADSHLLLHPSSSDLRVALRLLRSLPARNEARFSRLLTNHDKLMADNEMSTRVRDGASAIAAAMEEEFIESGGIDAVLLEAALCLVITNAVQVQDNEGCTVGIAVYGPNFSWINHSCSPNACYRFLISPPGEPLPLPTESRLRIVPATSNEDSGLNGSIQLTKGYGPRLIVRSIKMIKKGQEVTVAYTDLLQPKEIRLAELWSKYKFSCCCTRCSASPPSYIDHVLQEISAPNLGLLSSSSSHSFYGDQARKLTDYVDEVITDYLTVGDPESFCKKLESVLFPVFLEQLDAKQGKLQLYCAFHPMHHLNISAYMTLASAYKIRSSDALDLEADKYQLDFFEMRRISAAYSLLLAGATHHLFRFESSLIESVANFWTNAGDSLLALSRSSAWDIFGKWRSPISNPSSPAKFKCSKCSLLDRFEARMSCSQAQNADVENISTEFLDCITGPSQKVWSFLIQDCHHLKVFKDPVDFSWLGKSSNFEACLVSDHVGSGHWTTKSSSVFEANDLNDNRVNIFQLGVHCLLYGAVLADICYGPCSHLSSQILNILHSDEK